jgi:putative endonuclease
MAGLLYRAADSLRRRTAGSTRDIGETGEDMAHRYLRCRGCTVVARNYRRPSGTGEIDLVVWHGERLVFVEVKTRTSDEFGPPDAAVDTEKRRTLIGAARNYARRAGVEWEQTRFDIVSVVLEPRTRIEWIRDAFTPKSGATGYNL